MAEERRSGHIDLADSLKELKHEIKEDIKDLREDIKVIEGKIHDSVTTNNKFYFNGFEPHKHVADHHVIDGIIENMNDSKKMSRSLLEKWIDRVAWAAMTFIAYSTWIAIKGDVVVTPEKPPVKIEQKANENTTSKHP